MKCQEGWTGQVLLCGVTCTAHYRAWPEAFKPENCLHRAYVTIGEIYKAHGTRAQPSFHAATLWSNKCDHIAFRRDTLSSKQRSVFVIALLLEQNISSVELLGQFQHLPMCNVSRQQKNTVAVNSKSYHRQHRKHESIVRFGDSLLLTFKLSQYFSFPLSYRARVQMPLKQNKLGNQHFYNSPLLQTGHFPAKLEQCSFNADRR